MNITLRNCTGNFSRKSPSFLSPVIWIFPYLAHNSGIIEHVSGDSSKLQRFLSSRLRPRPGQTSSKLLILLQRED